LIAFAISRTWRGMDKKAVYFPERKTALEQWAAHLTDLVNRHVMMLQGAPRKNLTKPMAGGSA
jgi:hypothetical protein